MNARFLKRLQRRRLRVSQSRFRAALGKSPAPAAACANQQELDSAAVNPVANRRDLLARAQFAKLRQSNKPFRSSTLPGLEAHHTRVPDAPAPAKSKSWFQIAQDQKCPSRDSR